MATIIPFVRADGFIFPFRQHPVRGAPTKFTADLCITEQPDLSPEPRAGAVVTHESPLRSATAHIHLGLA